MTIIVLSIFFPVTSISTAHTYEQIQLLKGSVIKFSLNKKLKNLSLSKTNPPVGVTPQVAGASVNGGCVTGKTHPTTVKGNSMGCTADGAIPLPTNTDCLTLVTISDLGTGPRFNG